MRKRCLGRGGMPAVGTVVYLSSCALPFGYDETGKQKAEWNWVPTGAAMQSCESVRMEGNTTTTTQLERGTGDAPSTIAAWALQRRRRVWQTRRRRLVTHR